MKQDCLSPLRQCKKFSNINIIAFDTEDNSMGAPDNFLCCVFYDKQGMHQFTSKANARKFLFTKRKQTTIVFAHNLAYDVMNIDYPEGTIRLMPLKSRLIGGKWQYGKGQILRFMDTGNFFVGASIDQLGKTLGYPKLGCSCEEQDTYSLTGLCAKCGLFDIRVLRHKKQHDLPVELISNMLIYCGRDAEICYKIANSLLELSMKSNTRFKSFTASSLAMRIFRTNFLNTKWTMRSMEINDYERIAYYGGRTEVYDYSLHDKVIHEDIRSSYPTQMRNKIFPYPSQYAVVEYNWKDAKRFEGVSLVKVEVPKMRIPPLPHRREDGKLIFPYGTWIGAYTHPELRMAEQYGVKITKCYQSIIYSKTFNPFKDYINMFYNLKNTSTGIHRDFYKLMLNGLSGKFGEKSYTTIRGKIQDIDICICETKEFDDKSNMCRKCGKICINGLFVVPERNTDWINIIGARLPDSPHTFPILIAYITSYGRIQLYEDRLQYQDAIYTDTDSYMGTIAHDERIGKELGEWERDYMYNFKAHAPKFYTFTKADNTSPELKLKGVPRKHMVIWVCDVCSQEYKENYCPCCKLELGIKQKRYKFSRPVKLSEALKRHMKPNRWIKVTKQIAMFDDKRIKHDDGSSEPLYINETKEITTFKEMLKFYKMDTLGI